MRKRIEGGGNIEGEPEIRVYVLGLDEKPDWWPEGIDFRTEGRPAKRGDIVVLVPFELKDGGLEIKRKAIEKFKKWCKSYETKKGLSPKTLVIIPEEADVSEAMKILSANKVDYDEIITIKEIEKLKEFLGCSWRLEAGLHFDEFLEFLRSQIENYLNERNILSGFLDKYIVNIIQRLGAAIIPPIFQELFNKYVEERAKSLAQVIEESIEQFFDLSKEEPKGLNDLIRAVLKSPRSIFIISHEHRYYISLILKNREAINHLVKEVKEFKEVREDIKAKLKELLLMFIGEFIFKMLIVFHMGRSFYEKEFNISDIELFHDFFKKIVKSKEAGIDLKKFSLHLEECNNCRNGLYKALEDYYVFETETSPLRFCTLDPFRLAVYAYSKMSGGQSELKDWELNHLKTCPFCHSEYKAFLLYFERIGMEEFSRRAKQRGKELPFSLD
jgi:hypothetical protein